MGAIHEHLSEDLSGIVMMARRLSTEMDSSVEVYDAFRSLAFAANELIPLLGEPLRAVDEPHVTSAKHLANEGLASLDKVILPTSEG